MASDHRSLLSCGKHAICSVCAHCVVLDTSAHGLGEVAARLDLEHKVSVLGLLAIDEFHGAHLGVNVVADVCGGCWRRIRPMSGGRGPMRVVCEGGLTRR